MIKKFFIGFALIIAYLVIPGGILVSLDFMLPDSVIISSILVICAGFVPYMLWITRKVFTFHAKTNIAIEQQQLIEKISNLEIKHCQFSVENHQDYIVLKPPHLDGKFISFYSANHIQYIYYMKLWFNKKTKTVRFKDHLVSSQTMLGIDHFSFNISNQSGFIDASIYLLDISGKPVHFKNTELHNLLVDVVTENGWNLNLKVF